VKWILAGAVMALVMLLACWLIKDLAARAAVVAAAGAGFAGVGRWLLSLLKVEVDLADQPAGKRIKTIDLPGEVGKYIVVGVYLAGARLFLGYVAFV